MKKPSTPNVLLLLLAVGFLYLTRADLRTAVFLTALGWLTWLISAAAERRHQK
ncbi:MAG: hypothetical protein OSA06_01550 [Acidimicrobiales bacterium]|nr:hypothetical protein [Acidimicrobiales bacterium]